MTAAAALTALMCSFFWAGNAVAVKWAVEAFPPYLMAALRFALALVVTGGWAAACKLPLRLQRGQRSLVLINGGLLFAQIGLFNLGTHWSTAIHSSILINVYPFFTL